MTDQKPGPTPKKKKVHSETRQRTMQTKIRWLPEEFNTAAAKARASGYSFAAYIRAAATGDAGPRAQRALPVDAELLKEVLNQLGRYGNNLNQIAHQLNAYGPNGALPGEVRGALQDFGEIRALVLRALGQEPHPAA